MRTLKPQFFLNELLAEIDPLGRLLFQGLWCIADREGRLEDRPKRIKAEVLPYGEADVDYLLRVLHEAGFILRYAHAGQRCIQIANFAKHQRPHVKEVPSIIPTSDLPDAGPMHTPYSHSACTIPAPLGMGTDTVTDPGMETESGEPMAPVAAAAPAPAARPASSSARPPETETETETETERPRDLVWEACVAACGGQAPSSKVERGKWNKEVAALRESGATPDEIGIRAERYRRRYGARIALNPMALAGNWTVVATEVQTMNTAKRRATGAIPAPLGATVQEMVQGVVGRLIRTPGCTSPTPTSGGNGRGRNGQPGVGRDPACGTI